jgi:hypothetical protein
MTLKQFAATLRAEALAAPMPSENSKGQTTFMYETTYFRCLNNREAITAMADRIEKNASKSFASPLPKARVVRREPVKNIIKRFVNDHDLYNATQLSMLN